MHFLQNGNKEEVGQAYVSFSGILEPNFMVIVRLKMI